MTRVTRIRFTAPFLGIALVGLSAWGGIDARSEEVTLRKGRPVRGFVRVVGEAVEVNTFGCSVPEMTRGVRRLSPGEIESRAPWPVQDEIARRLEELGPGDLPRRLELFRTARSERLSAWVERLAEEILVLDPAQPDALKVVGGPAAWAERRRGTPRLDPALAARVRRMLRLPTAQARKQAAQELAQASGYDPGAASIERMVRSLQAPRGLRPPAPLRLGREDFPDASYVLAVPQDYDPLTPRPLLVALHGGGIRLEKGAATRGSPRDALAHFQEGAEAAGWFLLCPQAVEAPWPTSRNAAFLQQVLDEVCALWNIDLDRIHLVGQGGGADGAWFLGGRMGDELASVGVAAGGKPLGATSLSAKTAVWIYHGEEDDIVPVDPVRKVAESLRKKRRDFVYCELPKEGHGLAPAARRDYFRYVHPKRRRRAKSAWPRGSFETPSDAAVLRAFGDPAAAWGVGLDPEAPARTWMALLRSGQPGAEFAAQRLAENHAAARADLGADVRALVRDREAPRSARVWAAWLCGAWQDAEAVDVLGDTLRSATDPRLLQHAAEAVGRIGSTDSVQDLRWALLDVARRYQAVPGRTVPYQSFEDACQVGAAVADALGRCAVDTEGLFAELEEKLVRTLLMDTRTVAHVPENGEDPSAARAQLAEAVAAAYRRLRAEKTLFEMLALAVRGDKQATQGMLRGLRTPPR